MGVGPGSQLSLGIVREAMRIRPFKPFKLVRYSAHRSHNHTLRQTFAPPPLKAGRRFSPGLTILVLVAPVTSAFGCGYWLGNVIDNEKATLLEKDTSLEYGDEQAVQDALGILRNSLGQGSVSTNPKELHNHGVSKWFSVNTSQLPAAVVYPRTTEEVSLIASTCYRYRIPMISYSGGSSLEGHFSTPYGGFSIDFSRMDSIVEVHPDDMDVTVQPGLGWMDLNEKIKDTGLFFPVDPGPWARIGGMVSTSCSGTNAVRYGTMKDWVVNLTVVLADGTVVKTRRRPRKTSAGYNLTNLFIGSEGTLGLVTEATLKLTVIPEDTSVAVVNFPNIRAATSAAVGVLRAGVQIGAMELMDEVLISILNRNSEAEQLWKEAPTILFKFTGTKVGIKDSIRTVESITRLHQGGNFHFAKTAEQAEKLWTARKNALNGIMTLRDANHEVWSTDVAVPLSKLPDIIEISRQEADGLGMFSCCVGHVGDGNFHQSVQYERASAEEQERVHSCVYNMVDRALQMDGTCTGEHGVGLGKKDSLLQELGHPTVNVMRNIKRALDSRWLLNPGKIFDRSASKDMI